MSNLATAIEGPKIPPYERLDGQYKKDYQERIRRTGSGIEATRSSKILKQVKNFTDFSEWSDMCFRFPTELDIEDQNIQKFLYLQLETNNQNRYQEVYPELPVNNWLMLQRLVTNGINVANFKTAVDALSVEKNDQPDQSVWKVLFDNAQSTEQQINSLNTVLQSTDLCERFFFDELFATDYWPIIKNLIETQLPQVARPLIEALDFKRVKNHKKEIFDILFTKLQEQQIGLTAREALFVATNKYGENIFDKVNQYPGKIYTIR